MNVRWLKQNLIIIISAVVFVVLLALIIWFERKAAGEKDAVVSQLEVHQAQLTQLRTHDPSPSAENIEAVRRDREQLQQLYRQLQSGAVHDPVKAPELQRDIDFVQLMRETISRLSDSAARNSVKLADNFSFGFSRYDTDFPCRHPAAKPEDCKKLLSLLAKQLLIVEKLNTLLIQSRVDAITQVRRTEVEPGTAGGTDVLAAPISNDPKALYQTYPFELGFTCDESALRSFLNSLTQSDWFFAVRSVAVDAAASGTGSTPVASPSPRATGAPAPAEAPKAERRLLNVTVRVDLVEFTPVQPPAKGKT